MYLVSSCLAGIACRYDGKSNEVEEIKELVESGQAVALCPEVLGGLAIPRIPCEIQLIDGEQRVINKEREDVTAQFTKGAEVIAQFAKSAGIKKAILKGRSPSCGCGQIYDGTFSKTLIEGNGLAVQKLLELGIAVYSESNYELRFAD